MKVTYQTIKNENPYIMSKCIYKVEIISDILKKHYKALAQMSMFFKKNSGFIKKECAQEFLSLLSEIESSNDKRCATSHLKAKKTAAKRRDGHSNTKCDHADLGSLGYKHGETVTCPHCGQMAEVW